MRSAPKTSVLRYHLLDRGDRLGRAFWVLRTPLGLVLPVQTEELTMPTKDRLWLNKGACLFPGPTYPGQQYHKKLVRLLVDGAFSLSPENHSVVSQQRVFCKEFGFSSGQIGECTEHQGGR
jgi:hypothetical protein